MSAQDVFKATVIGLWQGQTAIVYDFGFQDQSGGSVHLDTGIAAGDFQTFIQATLVAASISDLAFVRYRFACTASPSGYKGEVGYVDPTSPVSGVISSLGTDLPAEIAISMKRNTGHASRKDRGRIFFGPISHSFVSDPDHPDRTLTPLVNVMNKLKATLTTQTVVLQPVLIAGDGTSSGRKIINVAMNPVFVHHRTRRPRLLI